MEHQEPAKKKRRRPRRRPRVQKPRPLSGNIVLCGFMGCGKSSVGRRVAKLLERQFCDLDSYIEQQAGMTVAEIFAKEGEAGFRAREAQAAEEVAAQEGMVIASGGGTVRRKVIAELYEKRVPLYRAAADITVDGGAPAVVVAKRVAALFQ